MPDVIATPRSLRNGEVITEFTDTTSTTAVTYTYPLQQAGISIENSGIADIFVTVGNYTNQVVKPNKTWKADAVFTSFSIRSNANSQEFTATAFQNDIEGSGEADSVARGMINSINARLAETSAKDNYQVITATPLVTFISDDGLAGDYSVLKPLFESKNAKLTLALRTNFINTGGVTTSQLQEFLANGHSLVSHTADHLDLTTLTDSEIENQYVQSIQDLKEIVGIDCNSIAYPHGAWNDKAVELARKYFSAAFATNSEGYSVNKSPIDQYVIARQTVVADGVARSLSTLQGYVDECIKNNGWLVFCIHAFEFADDATGQTNLSMLSSLLDYINTVGVRIVNHDEALQIKSNIIDVGNFKKGYFKVNKEGKFSSDALSNIATFISASTGINDTTPISAFQNNKISITNFVSTDTNAFPSGVSGTLYTNKSSTNLGLAFQLWYPSGDKRIFYKRGWNTTTGGWDPFYKFMPTELTAVTKISKTGITVSSLLDAFPSQQLTATAFLGGDNSGFPIVAAGTLFTNKLDSYDGFAYQLWIPLDSTNVFCKRTWNVGTVNWNAWSNYYPANKITATVSIGTVVAGAETTYNLPLVGAFNTKVVHAMPAADMPPGLIWSSYCKTSGNVIIRVRNFGAVDQVVPTNWIISVVG